MRLETRKLLFDAAEAGRSIRDRCAGQSFVAYASDRWFRRGVEREFEIIGEPLNRLDRLDPATASRITTLRRIVGFRYRIIHGYDAIDDQLVWGIVEKDLPVLLAELEFLMKEGDLPVQNST
jgi:uncharacterized protein with HEPN domain